MRGDPQFIGENKIGHTPMGSELGLAPGLAYDVKVQATVVKRERISDHRWRTQMSYRLTNARANPVTLDLVQPGDRQSVVSGKSGSVRVARGGSRIIQTKRQKT